jgi:SAM-dependent methyltransferase
VDEDGVIGEQMAYYRAVAPQYDVASSPRADPLLPFRRQIESALHAFRPAGRVLEIASRGGDWTVLLLRYASSVTALDSSPEMLAIAAKRTRGDPRVRYVPADVFAWQPDGPYDVVSFANWLSHVPPAKLAPFWETVGAALAPSGRVFLFDELEDLRRHGDVFREEFLEDSSVPVVRRSVQDGRTFRVVKVFWDPLDLQSQLDALGWEAEIHTAGPLFWAEASQPGGR